MLDGFSDLFKVLEKTQDAITKGTEGGLKTGAARIMGTAKAKLGTYQPASGPYPAWPKLKASSVRKKHIKKSEINKAENAIYVMQKGKYKGDIRFRRHLTKAGKKFLKAHDSWSGGGNDDSPLVDTGGLRGAITTDTSEISDGKVYIGVALGANAGAVAHEFGYGPKKIPARPYLRPSIYENRNEVKDDIAEAIIEAVERIWR